MKTCSVLVFIFLSVVALSAQTIGDCNARLTIAKYQLEKDSISEAINNLLWVKVCDEALSAEANLLILEAFQKIEKRKREAESAQKRAENAEKKVKAELEKSKRLSSFFNFGKEEASWAYNSENALFAVINNNGKQLSEFVYESPERFLNGVSFARITDVDQSRFVFLNTHGQEISPRFDYITSTFGNKYFVGHPFKVKQYDYHYNQYIVENKNTTVYSPYADIMYGIIFPRRPDGFMLTVVNDTLFGLVDTIGNVILPCEYRQIGLFSEGLAPVRKGDRFGVVDKKGTLTSALAFDDVWSFYEGLAPAKLNKKWGFIDPAGNWVIPPLYDAAWSFSNGLAQVRVDSLWGFIDKSGNTVIAPQYENCHVFDENFLAPVKKQNKWGYIDQNNITVLDFKYDQATSFSNGLATVKMDSVTALINTKGEIISRAEKPVYQTVGSAFIVSDTIIDRDSTGASRGPEQIYFYLDSILQPGYQVLEPLNDKLLLAQNDSLWGVISLNNTIVQPFKYNEIKSYGRDYSIVKHQNIFKTITSNGVEPNYEDIDIESIDLFFKFGNMGLGSGSFYSDRIKVYDRKNFYKNTLLPFNYNKKMGFADSTGRIIIPPEFDNVLPFSFNLAAVEVNNHWSYIDKKGKTKTSSLYRDAFPFIDAKGLVVTDSFNAIIDTSDHILFRCDSCLIHYPIIEEGLVIASQGEKKFGFIDTAGKWKTVPIYDQLFPFINNLALAGYNNKFGFIDRSFKWVIPPVYDQGFFGFDDGLCIMNTEEKAGVIDSLGQIVIPFQYEDIFPFFRKEGDLKLPENVNYTHYFTCKDSLYQETIIGVDSKNIFHILNSNGIEDDAPRYVTKQWDNSNIFNIESRYFGLMNANFDTLLPPEYTNVNTIGYHIYLLKQKGRFGLFAPDHQILLPCKYEKIGYLKEENGWIRVRQNGKWGWVACEKDRKGKMQVVTKIPCRFDVATPFENGQARVMQLPYPEVFKINYKGEMFLRD